MKLNLSLLLSLLAPSAIAAVATADDTVCSTDYQLTFVNGDTVVDRPIEITEQNGDTVTFKINQIWSPFGADSIFVGYKGSSIGEYDCDEYTSVGEFDDITVTATCMHNEPVTVIDLYVVDGAVSGGAAVPDCCHNGDPPSTNTVHYTYLLQCTPTCTGPNPSSDPECPEVVLDFNDLPDYSYVYDDYWYKYGVKITAKANSNNDNKRYTPLPKSEFPIGSDWADRYGFTENNVNSYTDDVWENLHNQGGGAARVFNTQKPDGKNGNPKCKLNDSREGDPDLGSPSKFCPAGTPGKTAIGPGDGPGGGLSSTWGWPNCPDKLIGNVLIIQEKRKSCPDDTGNGGTITFDFNPNIAGDVQFTFAELIDTDHEEVKTPKIYVWKSDENVNDTPDTAVYTTPTTGDNGLWYDSFDTNAEWVNKYKNIKRIQFEYHGSGSIAEIRYKPSKCPPQGLPA